MQDSPTPRNLTGGPAIAQWDPSAEGSAGGWADVGPDPEHQAPIAVQVPVTTLIGTLGNDPSALQTYPPMYSISGNVFELPDPTDSNLPDVYDGAAWFVEVTYGDGTTEQALVAVPAIDENDTALSLYSLNLDSGRNPTQVDLYQAATPYPNLVPSEATLVHTRMLPPPAEALPPVVSVGRGALANLGLELTARCEPDFNCVSRRVESVWRTGGGDGLHFQDPTGEVSAPAQCEEPDSYSVLTVPVVDEAGTSASVTVHAQRVLESGGVEVVVPLHDVTAWLDSPDMSQSLRAWLPYEANQGLAAGRWVEDPAYALTGALMDGDGNAQAFATVPITIDLQVLETTTVDLGTEWTSSGLTAPGSSMYFLVRDDLVGPTSRTWWGGAGPTALNVPVLDSAGAPATLVLDGWQESCGSRWDMHAGRGAGDCEHALVLSVAATGNEGLTVGETYTTSPSAPLVVDGRRWHVPDARALIGTFALHLSYTP
jgi:hypothetical protein